MNVEGPNGTPVMEAVFNCDAEAIRILAKHGADLGSVDNPAGITPLCMAARAPNGISARYSDCLRALLESGADVNTGGDHGALWEALRYGFTAGVEVLLTSGAYVIEWHVNEARSDECKALVLKALKERERGK